MDENWGYPYDSGNLHFIGIVTLQAAEWQNDGGLGTLFNLSLLISAICYVAPC